jgi:hypothetical protein
MQEDPGVLYVLTNVAMPGMVKIGLTRSSVQDRISELSRESGVPLAFECHFAAEVEHVAKKEKTLQQIFGDQRVNPKREFFRVAPEKAVLAISMGPFKEVTPGKTQMDAEEEKAFDKEVQSDIKKRSAINLAAIGIQVGTKLSLSRDENICATVVSGNKVEYEGQIMSLSAAALLALHKLGYQTPAASGSDYWMIDGDTLDEIRIKSEAQMIAESSPDDHS